MNVCIYIYAHTDTHTHKLTHTYTYKYVCMYLIYIHVYIYTCLYSQWTKVLELAPPQNSLRFHVKPLFLECL